MLRRYVPFLVLALAAGALVLVRTSTAQDQAPKAGAKAAPSADGKGATGGDPTATAKAGPAAPKGPTAKVEKGPLTASVSLKGVVEAEQTTELAVHLKAWPGPLLVKRAVEHGTPVKAGDVLVEFDAEKIDLALRDARQERDLAEIGIRQAEEEVPILERMTPIELAAAERGKKHADEDLKRFLEIERPLMQESAANMLRNAEFSLQSQKDELKQLEKMYKDKDLTEETEQIILRRYRHYVTLYEFFLKMAQARHEQALRIELPRHELTVRENAEKTGVTLDRARNVLPLTLRQKRLALAKAKYENDKAQERLQNLEQDRAALVVRAPSDGVAYHGRSVRGQWPPATPPGAPAKLLRGGNVAPEEVVVTVVAAGGPAFVRATAEEKDRHLLHEGMEGKVIPTAYPDLKVPARLARLVAAPQGGGFDARVEFQGGKAPEALVPGMSCTAKFVAFRKPDALSLPAAVVFTDDGEDETRYVYLAPKGPAGKAEKKVVKVGKTAGDRVEILDGLKEGDEVLTAKP
jgi:multidrug efflux pump subunit AcrA (membrane-fusion protein)